MLTRDDLPEILEKTLKALGGQGRIVDVCRYVWQNYEKELKASGDLFFTWQYDIRWAATELRHNNRMKDKNTSPVRLWQLK